MLALAGEPLSRQVALTAAQMPESEQEQTIRSLRRKSLLRKAHRGAEGAIEIYHDRFREAIVSRLSATVAQTHHRSLAIALHRFDEGNAAQLARHWSAAGDRQRALDYTKKAAEEALATLAFDRAAAFYSRALETGDFAPPERREIQLALAETLARAARGPEAAEVYATVAQDADAQTRLLCEKRAAEQWMISGHVDKGLEAVGRLLATLGVSLPRSPWIALASILANRLWLRVIGLRWVQRVPGSLSEREAMRLDVYRSVSQGLGMVDPIRGSDFQTRLLRLTLKSGDPTRVARALLSEANYRSTLGPHTRPQVERLLAEGRRIAERVGDSYLIAFTLGSEGFVHYYSSEFQQAHNLLSRSDELFSERTVDAVWERNTIRLVRLWSLMRMARFESLIALYDRYVREATRGGDRYSETTLRRSATRVWLAADRVDMARSDLDRTNWIPPEGRFHLQHWYVIRATSEIALYEGRNPDFGDFRALNRSMLTRAQFVRAEALWLQARLLLVKGRDAHQIDRLGARLRRERIGYARVWGLLVQATVAAHRGAEERATTLFRQAATIGAEQEMHLCSQAARYRLGTLLGGAFGAEMVSDARQRMTEMGVKVPTAMLNVVAPTFVR